MYIIQKMCSKCSGSILHNIIYKYLSIAANNAIQLLSIANSILLNIQKRVI